MLYLQAEGSLCKQVSQKGKKLVAVLATTTSMTKKTEEELKRVNYIRYSVTYKDQTEALLDLGSEINAISQVFTHHLCLKI